jgi:hypothetical protein
MGELVGMEELVKQGLQYSIWTGLAIFLIKYIIDENKKREAKFQEIIEKNQQIILGIVPVISEMKRDLEHIRECVVDSEGQCMVGHGKEKV